MRKAKPNTQRPRSVGRGKWMVVANMTRFLSVSVTELVVKKTQIKEARMILGMEMFVFALSKHFARDTEIEDDAPRRKSSLVENDALECEELATRVHISSDLLEQECVAELYGHEVVSMLELFIDAKSSQSTDGERNGQAHNKSNGIDIHILSYTCHCETKSQAKALYIAVKF